MGTKAKVCMLLVWFVAAPVAVAYADAFRSGANTFNIEFVNIGNPANPADTTGIPNPAGKVEYAYRMGKYEVSRGMIRKANAEGSLGITLSNMGDYGGNGADKRATGVSWFEAATFVNWLNTSTNHSPAYKFVDGNFQLWQSGDAGYNPANPFRNSEAYYFLPSMDEWYKAAYYNPTYGFYHDFPTAFGPPSPVASGTDAFTAVYFQAREQGPANIMLAGGLSPYGTIGQGGNVWEWEETDYDLVNDDSSSSSYRGLRGGVWDDVSGYLHRTIRYGQIPSVENFDIGFRVASIIPEPSTMLLGMLASLGLLMQGRR